MVHHQAVFLLRPDLSSCWRKAELREDSRSSACPFRTAETRQRATLSLAWLQLLPVLSSEQAVSLQEGQEIVGTRRISAAPATSPRKLLPQHNVTNSGSSKGGVKQPKRKLENNEEVDVTPLPLERLRVGAPDPAGVRVCSLKLIDKNKAQFPR